MHWFDPDYARKCCYQTNKLDVESLRENIPSSLETEMTWWWAWSPGPTPGTWSQRSPRFCITAESEEEQQHADLEREGGAVLLTKDGVQVATA